ncbi:hypothetical protein [Mycetohabitans endofungorum]|uniref:hypothetical protein n=1 Tax=Mycetohabitans endofungorum TaxID=417203 RepID=UPI002B062604|nr:hypothetical protein [Mycetohabitans endofungorum]
MLERIFIVPPLAFARVGTSTTPCDAFLWGPNDVVPRGSGTTTLQPAETLSIASDGTVTSRIPDTIIFRDAEGIRPVCPFFELHARWTNAAGEPHSGPVTQDLLDEWGIALSDIEWQIELGNLKAFHYTYEVGDRIEAYTAVQADNHIRTSVMGVSPAGAALPLIRAGRGIPMGAVQAAKPSADFPEIRLRFYAPAGVVYGPEDLPDRLASLDYDVEVGGATPNQEWRDFKLPFAQLTVNPSATWPRYVPDAAALGPFFGQDNRNTPAGLFAAPFSTIPWLPGAPLAQRSLGLVDDVSDGFVKCKFKIQGNEFAAVARVVVGPPDFAPANRPPISLADNLADREDREGARDPSNWTKSELCEVVLDILERALETSDLMHRDYQNWRSVGANINELMEAGSMSPFDADDLRTMLWPVPPVALIKEGRIGGMALSEAGTWKHRRYATLEYLEDRFRENPALFDQIIRRPVGPSRYYDKRMPALMRGSDGRPLHLTRRQWEIFQLWIMALQADAPAAGIPGKA